MIRLTAILASLLLAACATPPEVRRPTARMVTINIVSLPPGAAIYHNAEFIGVAPLRRTVEADADGNWKQGARFQAYVPHDASSYEEAIFPEGYAVPRNMLLRVPGYTDWYNSVQRYARFVR